MDFKERKKEAKKERSKGLGKELGPFYGGPALPLYIITSTPQIIV
jgi:hypothetical protein